MAGADRVGAARFGADGHRRHGLECPGGLGLGKSRQAWMGPAGYGKARLGLAGLSGR
jgi:hypothetical protein